MEPVHVAQKYVEPRQCIQCKTIYKEINNIGHLCCRIHPGLRLCDSQGREFFSCCGLYIDAFIEGKVTSRALLGCVAIDHMDETAVKTGNSQLSVTNLDDRLNDIKHFSIIGVPISILNSVHHVLPPLSSTILFDFDGITGLLPSSPLVENHITAFTQTRRNHEYLKVFHDPYAPTKFRYREKIENTPFGDDETNKARDTISIDVHDMSERLTKNAVRRNSTVERNNRMRDGWPSLYTKKDGSIGVGRGNDEEQVSVGKRAKTMVPFMVIQRIEDKLEIPLNYTKLNEI